MNNLTPQQAEVVTAIHRGESVSVRSVAGSGKTSTLVAAHQTSNPSRTLCIAFNKKNAEDLAAKMPPEVTSKTFNSIGHSTWAKFLGKNLKLDKNKLWGLFRDYKHAKELGDEAADIVKLARLAKVFGLAPGYGPSAKTQTLPDMELWEELATQFDIEDFELLAPHALHIFVESNKAAWQGNIDFDDQIFCPVVYEALFESFDRVSVDEAQDLSSLQHKMVERLVAKAGQIVVVGDPDQALYAFRGADNDSFDKLTRLFYLKKYKLTTSFRCPEEVCKEARKYVPDIESGTGRRGAVNKIVGPLELSKGLCIASRTNAPIIRLAFEAIRKGIPVDYLGRDFMFGLKALNDKYPTLQALEGWKRSQEAKSEAARKRISDRYDSMLAIHLSAKEARTTPKAIIAKLSEESKAGNALVLGTIHKLKGLEYSHVAFLDYDKTWTTAQAHNMNYVGTTRAIETLTLHYEKEENLT